MARIHDNLFVIVGLPAACGYLVLCLWSGTYDENLLENVMSKIGQEEVTEKNKTLQT